MLALTAPALAGSFNGAGAIVDSYGTANATYGFIDQSSIMNTFDSPSTLDTEPSS